MKFRLHWICRDCDCAGLPTCQDGNTPFVTDAKGEPFEFTDPGIAEAGRAKHRGAMDVKILVQDKGAWLPFTPPPKARSVLD